MLNYFCRVYFAHSNFILVYQILQTIDNFILSKPERKINSRFKRKNDFMDQNQKYFF